MPEPVFSETLELDLSTIEPSLAGPKRPQDRISLYAMKSQFNADMANEFGTPRNIDGSGDPAIAAVRAGAGAGGDETLPAHGELYRDARVPVAYGGVETHLTHGSVVIAAITSCTNTSNPSVMVGAGLLAKNAVERGLDTKP